MTSEHAHCAKQWAFFYRQRGFQPLPGRMDAKRPFCKFADWWNQTAPDDLFDRFPTTNIQLMTGRHWRLLVIDLDGEAAKEQWKRFSHGRLVRTWITHSGGDGLHLWFTLPPTHPVPLPKVFLWKEDDLWKAEAHHSSIERLCDHSLITAPPSIHPRTGQKYQFLNIQSSPQRLPLPMRCPEWVLSLAPIKTSPTFVRTNKHARWSGRAIGFTQSIEALVCSWGVRICGRPSAKGWIQCHAIDRPDRHPSAAIHKDSGFYLDHGSGDRLSLYDLAVRLGIYRDRNEAIQHLGVFR